MDLSVIIPAFDEEGSVGQAVADVHSVCRGMGLDYEVFAVDGGSRDRTAELAQQAGAAVLTQREPGYGASLREGFAAARHFQARGRESRRGRSARADPRHRSGC